MDNKKPTAYFKHVLAFDCESSGIAFGQIDPSKTADGKTYQMVSAAFIVADSQTFKPVDKLYVEIKWNGESEWDMRAQNVHGLSKKYLEKNGISEKQAVLTIGNFIAKYFGPTSDIRLLGHNVATFDKFFLDALFKKFGIELSFGNRHLDVWSLGLALLGTYNSDQIFQTLGMQERTKHNAMEDIEMSLKSVRIMSTFWKKEVNITNI